MGWHIGNGMGWWGGGLYMLLIFVLIVVCAIMMARWSSRSGSGEDSSLEILKRRYARGELTREQFEAMKKEIQ